MDGDFGASGWWEYLGLQFNSKSENISFVFLVPESTPQRSVALTLFCVASLVTRSYNPTISSFVPHSKNLPKLPKGSPLKAESPILIAVKLPIQREFRFIAEN